MCAVSKGVFVSECRSWLVAFVSESARLASKRQPYSLTSGETYHLHIIIVGASLSKSNTSVMYVTAVCMCTYIFVCVIRLLGSGESFGTIFGHQGLQHMQ